jgi:hypothetical protein
MARIHFACLLWFAAGSLVHAENYAVLAGISHYAIGEKQPQVNLEGPANDLPSLRQALIGAGFAPERVTMLLDRDAGRQAILDALRNTVKRAVAGDFVVFYFSGHGTSSFDAHFEIASDLGSDTGALIPYDIDPTSREAIVASVIIGHRDLRPILGSLNPQARALVILDACYSQNSSKGLDLRGAPRFLDLREFLDGPVSGSAGGSASIDDLERMLTPGAPPDTAYPYSNVVSLAAAAKSETAADIGTRLLSAGKVHSIDQKPHGAFTNSLLKGLAGAADTDHDGKITVDELYRFAREDVRSVFKHTPQILQPEGSSLATAMSFRVSSVVASKPQPPIAASTPPLPAAQSASLAAKPDRVISVKLDGAFPELRGLLAGLPGIAITEGEYDLMVRSSATGYDLYDGSRTVIGHFAHAALEDLARRISAEPQLMDLIGWRFAKQDFNVSVDVTDPLEQGSYQNGQHLAVSVSTTESSFLLLLDIDATGTITVLYPGKASEAGKVSAGAKVRVINGAVRPPFGLEYLKLFAFKIKPNGYEHWLCRDSASGGLECPEIAPGSAEFRSLMRMLQEADSGRAEARLEVVTDE